MDICVKNVFSVKNIEYDKLFELDQNFPMLDEGSEEMLSNRNKNTLDSFGSPAVDHSDINLSKRSTSSSKQFDFSFQNTFMSARQLSQSVNNTLKPEVDQRGEENSSRTDFLVPTCDITEILNSESTKSLLKDGNAKSGNQLSPEYGNNNDSGENVKSITKHKVKSEKIKPSFGSQSKKILKLKDNNKSPTKNISNIKGINDQEITKNSVANPANPLSSKSSLKENSIDTVDNQEKLLKAIIPQIQVKSKNINLSLKKAKSSKCKQENNGHLKNVPEVSHSEKFDNNNQTSDNLKLSEVEDVLKPTKTIENKNENDRISSKIPPEKITQKLVPPLKISAINCEIQGNFPKFKSELTEKYVKENKKQKKTKAKNTSLSSCGETQALQNVGKNFSQIMEEHLTSVNNTDGLTERETVIKTVELKSITTDKKKKIIKKELKEENKKSIKKELKEENKKSIKKELKEENKKSIKKKEIKDESKNLSNETIAVAVEVSHNVSFSDMDKQESTDSYDIDDQDDISDTHQNENIDKLFENIHNSKNIDETSTTEKTTPSAVNSESSDSVLNGKPLKKHKFNPKFGKHDKNKLKLKRKRKISTSNEEELDVKQGAEELPDSPSKKIVLKIKNTCKKTEKTCCPKSKASNLFNNKKVKDNGLALTKKKTAGTDKSSKNIKLKKTDIKTKTDKKKNSHSCESKIPCKKKCMQTRNIYESGTWVECTQLNCHKWRWLQHVHDPLTIPHNWICDMNPDPTQNDCSLPEIEYCEEEFIFTRYTEGSVVWARVDGYPWWPAMVEIDPDYTSYFEFEVEECMYPAYYHVVFFGKKVSRAWVPVASMKPFEKGDHPPLSSENVKYSMTDQRNEAIKSANEAVELELKTRLKMYSFSKRFSGSWGSCDCEGCDKCPATYLSDSC